MKILGYSVFDKNLDEIDFTKKKVICTINPHSYVLAKSDVKFNEALKNSDILLPDGIGIVYAAKWLKKKKLTKLAGSDIHQFLLERSNLQGLKVFYMGSSNETLRLIEERIDSEFPSISVGSYSPPYAKSFTKTENDKILFDINNFKPNVLFVGMTAPKQEKWVYENYKSINADIIVSIGAVFDFYAGTIDRPSTFWINIGLEWFPRFLKEPKRLWSRNFVSTPKFLLDIVKFRFKLS